MGNSKSILMTHSRFSFSLIPAEKIALPLPHIIWTKKKTLQSPCLAPMVLQYHHLGFLVISTADQGMPTCLLF